MLPLTRYYVELEFVVVVPAIAVDARAPIEAGVRLLDTRYHQQSAIAVFLRAMVTDKEEIGGCVNPYAVNCTLYEYRIIVLKRRRNLTKSLRNRLLYVLLTTYFYRFYASFITQRCDISLVQYIRWQNCEIT